MKQVVDRALQDSPLRDPHHLHVYTGEEGTTVTFHCRSAAATVGEGHELASRLEDDIRTALPGVGQIVIHVEPQPEK